MTEQLCPNQGKPPPAAGTEALAVRPMMEQVARMGDCIGANTVGEIMAISQRAAAWLAENPPGQPVAIEPRGCPIPGACSCVEPAPPAVGEVADQLSPAAQAVIDALYMDELNGPQQLMACAHAAAALRAATDQVLAADPCGDDCCIAQCENIRADFLAIAAELKGIQPSSENV